MFYKFDSIKMHFFNDTGGGEAAGGVIVMASLIASIRCHREEQNNKRTKLRE